LKVIRLLGLKVSWGHIGVEQAKTSIIKAFSRLVHGKRTSLPSIAQVLTEAGIARSTLYRHFDDRTSLLVAAMHEPFEILSKAAVEGKASPQLIELLEHFWRERRVAVELLGQPSANRLARKLGEQINAKHRDLERDDAVRVAHTQLTLLRLWLGGETPGSAAEVAGKIAKSSVLQIGGFVQHCNGAADELD
jgi:AcrR family transcriptional regulator